MAWAEERKTEDRAEALHRALLHVLVGPVDERSAGGRSGVPRSICPRPTRTFHLLPLASRRFADLAGDDADRLSGVYRYSWYRNRMLVRSATRVLRALDDAGVPHLVLKGAALGVTTYHDAGTWPITDVDVLVHADDKQRAVDLLLSADWVPDSPVPAEMLRVHHAFNVRPDHSPRSICTGGSSTSIATPRPIVAAWQRSVVIELDGVATARCSSPTDQLLQALVHAEPEDLRWIVDTALLVESGAVDWPVLCTEAEARQSWDGCSALLTTAVEMGGFDVPAEVFRRLATVALNPWDRVVQRTQDRPSTRSVLAAGAVDSFARRTRGPSPTARVRGRPLPRSDQRHRAPSPFARRPHGAAHAPRRPRLRAVSNVPVSVVIPAVRRGAVHPPGDRQRPRSDSASAEVIVADDGSTDATAALVTSLGSEVHLLHSAHGGAGAARNRGIRHAHPAVGSAARCRRHVGGEQARAADRRVGTR